MAPVGPHDFRVCLLVAALARCTLPPSPTPPPESDHRARLEGVVVDRFEHDDLASSTHLERAVVDRETGKVEGEQATARVLGEGPEPRAVITAPRAEADLRARTVRMSGGVRLVDDEGRVMTTDVIRYRAAEDDLQSEGAVRVEGAGFTVDGARLVGKPKAGQLELEGPVEARTKPASD